MRRAVALALGSLALLLASPALPCGAPFGPGMQTPTMNILVVLKAGVETYVFQPHFCGEASDFGLILPIPAALTANPTLAGDGLFAGLATISAPKYVTKKECNGKNDGAGGTWHDAGASRGDAGAQVIDRGQVGIFDWVLLKADTATAFTDWLDANGFPHTAAADPLFAHYVTKAWYFVAFKVSAGEAPPAGTTLCGDLGPIQLSFTAEQAVVPTRIAAAAGDYYTNWTLYGISATQQLAVTTGQGYDAKPGYSGALKDADLASAAALAALAATGDRLVKIDLGFYTQVSDDLTLTLQPAADFRATVEQIEYVDCGDCAVGPVGASGTSNPGLLLVPLLAFGAACGVALRSRHRR
jgi:hypothetical protein